MHGVGVTGFGLGLGVTTGKSPAVAQAESMQISCTVLLLLVRHRGCHVLVRKYTCMCVMHVCIIHACECVSKCVRTHALVKITMPILHLALLST